MIDTKQLIKDLNKRNEIVSLTRTNFTSLYINNFKLNITKNNNIFKD